LGDRIASARTDVPATAWVGCRHDSSARFRSCRLGTRRPAWAVAFPRCGRGGRGHLPALAVERAVQRATYRDAIGTLPVEMSLCRQGRSTLETGILGDLYWAEFGAWGWGVRAWVTGLPVADGTLASYADRRFIRANVQFIEDPDASVSAYATSLRPDHRAGGGDGPGGRTVRRGHGHGRRTLGHPRWRISAAAAAGRRRGAERLGYDGHSGGRAVSAVAVPRGP